MGLPLEPAPELPSECVERILWFVSRDTEGDPRVIRALARISKAWKRAADANATYVAMLLHRYGVDDLSLPFTRHRVDWGPNGGTLDRAPNREYAHISPESLTATSLPESMFDFRTPTDAWTAEEMRAELRKAGFPNPEDDGLRFDESRTERFVPSPSSAAAMLARRNQKAPDARACFLEWHEDYGDVEPRLFRRMRWSWATVENAFATQGMESVLSTILTGETKKRCDAFARYWHMSMSGLSSFPKGKKEVLKMHPSLALLYRLRGGQMVSSLHAGVCGAGGFDPKDSSDAFDVMSYRHGVLGGFSVYEDNRCVALYSFDHAAVWMRRFRLHELERTSDVLRQPSQSKMQRFLGMVDAFRLAPFAGSWDDGVWNPLCADVGKGTIHAHVPPLGGPAKPDHPWAPPTAHPEERFGVEYDACYWFGEYANRVHDGMYRVAHDVEDFLLENPSAPDQPLPLIGPMMWRIPRSSFQGGSMDAHETTLYSHVSRGALQVTVGVAHAGLDAYDDPRRVNQPPDGSDIFTYEVTLSLLSEDEQRRRFAESGLAGSTRFEPLRSAQLKTRRWVIKEGVEVLGELWFSDQEKVVEGPGVIGMFPRLTAGGEPFRYRSKTGASRMISSSVMKELKDAAKWRVDLRMMLQTGHEYVDGFMALASMAGSFAFSTDAPGGEFEATCPEFMLRKPAYEFGSGLCLA